MALSAPATNATGAAVVIAPAATSVTTTIIDNDTQTFSLTQASTTVNEGSADIYTVHLSNPIDPGVTVSATIAITLPGGLGGAEAADFTHAFLADIDAAIALTTGVTRSGNTLTFNSSFDTSAGFSFTLPTLNDTQVEGNESYSVALSAPATNATGAAVVIAPAATSVTTTIIDSDTQTFSLTQASTTVTEGSADIYTVHLSNPIDPGVTVSATIDITLPGGLGGAEAADFTHAFLADIDAAIAATAGVTRSGNTLTFNSSFNTSAGFSFTLPTLNDTLVEGNETYSLALSAPTTNATGAAVALAPAATSVTTTILDNDTQTFSLTQASTTVTEGSADIYTVHLSNPIDPGVTVSATIDITLPGGLGGAEAADFTHAFLADIDAAIAPTAGVTRSGNTLTFNSASTPAPASASPCRPSTTPWSRATRPTAWRCQRRPPTPPAPRSRSLPPPASPPPSSTTTPRPSRSPKPTPPSPRAAPTSTRSISPTRSIQASPSASPSTSSCRAGSAAPRRRISPMRSWPTSMPPSPTTGVTRSGNTLTFNSSFNTSAGFSFSLPTLNDTLVEGNESYSLALSAPTTNAPGAAVALAPAATSVTTTILDNDTQTFSLTQASTTVPEGSADIYTVHLSNPIDPGVTVSVNIAIALPGGLSGAEAADFTHAFLADIDAAIALTPGSPARATR